MGIITSIQIFFSLLSPAILVGGMFAATVVYTRHVLRREAELYGEQLEFPF